jgi:hypothetical protein
MTLSEPLASTCVGGSFLFSLELAGRENAASETVRIRVLE